MAVNHQKDKVPLRIDGNTWATIESLICEDWSPEQIAGWMKLEMDISASHEWIYHHIMVDRQSGGDLYRPADAGCRKKRKKRYSSNDRRGQIRNKVSIDECPPIVETKKRLGDWEADTIIGQTAQTSDSLRNGKEIPSFLDLQG